MADPYEAARTLRLRRIVDANHWPYLWIHTQDNGEHAQYSYRRNANAESDHWGMVHLISLVGATHALNGDVSILWMTSVTLPTVIEQLQTPVVLYGTMSIRVKIEESYFVRTFQVVSNMVSPSMRAKLMCLFLRDQHSVITFVRRPEWRTQGNMFADRDAEEEASYLVRVRQEQKLDELSTAEWSYKSQHAPLSALLDKYVGLLRQQLIWMKRKQYGIHVHQRHQGALEELQQKLDEIEMAFAHSNRQLRWIVTRIDELQLTHGPKTQFELCDDLLRNINNPNADKLLLYTLLTILKNVKSHDELVHSHHGDVTLVALSASKQNLKF